VKGRVNDEKAKKSSQKEFTFHEEREEKRHEGEGGGGT
jgi:hypothetical protein